MPVGPVIALSHGGGPMPLLGDPAHAAITASLRTRVPALLGLDSSTPPRAIILITAHWRTPSPRISSAPSPPLLYDYHGFPAPAYALRYPAPGDPQLARDVAAALAAAGFAPALDPDRGWDHGVFVPMLLAAPAARVPIVQVSVLAGDDAADHLRMGAALHGLRADGVAVLGSGFASLHNFAAFAGLRAGGDGARAWARRVDAWNAALEGALGAGGNGGAGGAAEGRDDEALRGWREMPHAWDVHPAGQAEHLMPLMVCAGAAMEGEAAASYEDEFQGVKIKTFYWGADLAA
ncbi:hypothetical protein ESCO_004375 [Escovopsis weberi]|uniref:Extradiol ring-cleavage dioxygenase class III enzyme subunit B domain-containing protein n=1 Tax=Escovopsis weberi TaxID=150374 RepID=A0A0M9VVA2_ESCWE|nr:hypothetical protein ESCO_004375 [Escovopsis weberi]